MQTNPFLLLVAGIATLPLSFGQTCGPASDDTLEENDTCLTAGTIPTGVSLGLYASDVDPDFYMVTIPPNQLMDFTFTLTGDDLDLNVYDTGCLLIQNFNTNGITGFSGGPTGMTVIVEVFVDPGFVTLGCANYDATVTFSPDLCGMAMDDSLEENDTCLTAGSIPTGMSAGLVCRDTDPDFYTVSIPANMALDFNITLVGDDLDLRVYDMGCNLLQSFNTNGFLAFSGGPTGSTVIVEVFVDPGFVVSGCSVYTADVQLVADPCAGLAVDAFEENDDCASAAPISDGLYTDLTVAMMDKDNYRCAVDAGATIIVDTFFLNATADCDLFIWDPADIDCGAGFAVGMPLAAGVTTTDNEQVVWTNNTGACMDVIITADVWTGSTGNCNTYDMQITGSLAACGVNTTIHCDPASLNTTGSWAKLDTSSASGPGSFHLECTDGPPGQFGYFLIGDTLMDPGILVSNGFLCLSLPLGRYNPGSAVANGNPDFNSLGSFDGSGVFQNIVGTSSVGSGFDVPAVLPQPPGPGMISPGQTWYFQCWYRDAAGGMTFSNFSNVIGVNF